MPVALVSDGSVVAASVVVMERIATSLVPSVSMVEYCTDDVIASLTP